MKKDNCSVEENELQKENQQLRIENDILKQPAPITESAPIVLFDALSLELGQALLPLVDKEKGAELLERIPRLRREFALDFGLAVPFIRVTDNMRLDPSEYCFKINGVEVGSSKIRMGSYLCMNTGKATEELTGEPTTDLAFGLPAIWVAERHRKKAKKAGYAVVDPPTIISTHLTELIKSHATEILGRQEVDAIVETLRKNCPVVVKEVTKLFNVGEIRKVLHGLLREQVSIRNMVTIFETLADFGTVSKKTDFLVEKVRQALGRQICLQYADENCTLHVLTVEEDFLQKLLASRVDMVNGPMAILAPVLQRGWITALSSSVALAQGKGYIPVIVCSEETRILIKASTEREMPDLVVLSVHEITHDIKLENLGEIKIELMQMTKDEVEEYKTMEEHLFVKSRFTQLMPELLLSINDMVNQSENRLAQLMFKLLHGRMRENIVNADVIITNPTGFAIAVLYDKEVMHGPMVMAKGQDELAQQIKRIAKENTVPMIENLPLARSLYAKVEIGDIIPEEYYTDLATILGKVYAVKGKK